MEAERSYFNIGPGDPAPWFHGRTMSTADYAFDVAAGRYLVMCFFLSAGDAAGQATIKAARAHWRLFDDYRFAFFGITADPRDEAQKRIADRDPGYRYFLDYDGAISRLYGAAPKDVRPGEQNVPARRMWMVIDPMLRILKVVPFEKDGGDREKLFRYLATLPPPSRFAGLELPAPVLLLNHVFEPELCKELISLHKGPGGDLVLTDEKLIAQTRDKVRRRVAAEIAKSHQFKATRIERYLVRCYAADDGANLQAHRDNATKATAHRRFAVAVNLNDDFDGGELCFPEYGARGYKMPQGAACVFSCSLLHKVSRITRGRRYAFLPFLFDDESAKLRLVDTSAF